MYVIDLDGNQYACQIDTTESLEKNGNRVLSATIVPSKVNRVFIDDIERMWSIVDHSDIEYKIVYLRKRGEGALLTVDIKAIPIFFDVMDNTRIYEVYNEHMTANRCFALIFEQTDFNVILNGNFSAVEWQGFGKGDSLLELFKRAIDRYEAEFRIVGNTVYLENMIGRDTQFQYRHRLNASNIVEETDANEFWTYAIGYGDYEEEGEDSGGYKEAKLIREYTSPLAQIPGIGIRHAPPIMDGRVTDRATMDRALKRLVDESLKISLTANIHDLRRQGYALAQPELGDRVFVIDERIGLKTEVRVEAMTIKRNWRGEVTNLDLTFGSPGITRRHQSGISSAARAIRELLEGKRQLPPSVYDARIWEATNAMKNVRSELMTPENGGLMAVDKDNPNNVVIFNSNGLFVSDDGGATAKQAIWGGGINATVITAGTMLADRIGGGILSSLNGRTVFDLNNGLLQMQNTEFQLGGGAMIEFGSPGNRLYYERVDGSTTRTSGIGVGNAINNTYPVVWMGTTGTSKSNFDPIDTNYFTGFIANTSARAANDGIGNSVVGHKFHIRDQAVSYNKGFEFDLYGSTITMRGMSTGSYDYQLGLPDAPFQRIITNHMQVDSAFTMRNRLNLDRGWRMETGYSGDGHGISIYGLNTGSYNYILGKSTNRFTNVYSESFTGTLSSTSTKNAKMNIEDVDGRQAFDYVDMMDIKSYYYKGEDYTNPYNRKVSPIIEQLDPTLENLYKATPETLDVNSNLWLLALAFKYDSKQKDMEINLLKDRLEALENAGS